MKPTLIVTKDAWPHGLRCIDCDKKLPEGSAYSKRLIGIADDCAVIEIVCALCGLGLKEQD